MSRRHCEERRDEAIQFWSAGKAGLRRFARNDTPTKIHPALETWRGMSYQTVLTPPEEATGKVIYPFEQALKA